MKHLNKLLQLIIFICFLTIFSIPDIFAMGNRPPEITSTAPTNAIEDEKYIYNPEAVDSDGDTLSWSLTNPSSGMVINQETGLISWTPGEGILTSGEVTLTVNDGNDGSDNELFTISVTPVNNPPSINGTPEFNIIQGNSYSFTPIANDPDGDQLIFNIENKPEWADFNLNTGELSGTPGSSYAGTTANNIVISVSDSTHSSSLPPFNIAVTNGGGGGTIIEEGLVAYYPFNGNANDESGNGNDGIEYNATLTEDRFGNTDSAYLFANEYGNRNHIEVPTTYGLPKGNEPRTISAWIKPIDGQSIIRYGYNSKNSVAANVISSLNSKLRYRSYYSNSNFCEEITPFYEWNHIAMVYDGSYLKLYINGILDESSITAMNLTTINDNKKILFGYGHMEAYDWHGYLDEVCIYNRALSDEEIKNLMGQDPLPPWIKSTNPKINYVVVAARDHNHPGQG